MYSFSSRCTCDIIDSDGVKSKSSIMFENLYKTNLINRGVADLGDLLAVYDFISVDDVRSLISRRI